MSACPTDVCPEAQANILHSRERASRDWTLDLQSLPLSYTGSSKDSEQSRQRGDSNPCGRSPMDFESISLAARTHCHVHVPMHKHFFSSSKGSEPQHLARQYDPLNLGCRGHNATSWPLDDVGRWWSSILWTLDRASLGFGVPKTTEISAAIQQQQFSSSNSAAAKATWKDKTQKDKLSLHGWYSWRQTA